MEDSSTAILNKLLSIDLSFTASRLGFVSCAHETLELDDVYSAIRALDQLSLVADDGTKRSQDARNLFISIAALLWEHASTSFGGIAETLIFLLSKIGYSPSSIILDESFKDTGRFAPFQSLFAQYITELRQRRFEIEINGIKEVLTDFQYKIWNRLNEHRIIGVSAPTSSGKSFVLLLAAVNFVIRQSMDIIYVVPTISLINQVTKDFISAFKKYDCTSYEILNTYNVELTASTSPKAFVRTTPSTI